jgi:hypothetical protein
MKRLLVVLALAVGAAPLEAFTTGTVNGCIKYKDVRKQGNADGDVHALHVNRSEIERVPFIGATVRLVNSFGQLLGRDELDNSGCYSFSWGDPSGSFPSTGYRLRVYLENDKDWYVTDQDGRTLMQSFRVTLHDNNETLDDRVMRHGDEIYVAQTAAEFWKRIVDKSAHLSDKMTAFRFSANVSDEGSPTGCREGISCAVNANHVSIIDGVGLTKPQTTVAHETGHSVMMHALGLDFFLQDVVCGTQHDFFEPTGCDRLAWSEGFADFISVVFGWSPNATEPDYFSGADMEALSECSDEDAPRLERCQAGALWDIYDDPSAGDGDDDAIDGSNTNVNIASIVNVLKAYPDGCWWWFDDRCSNEGGAHGPNHWDFLKNFSDVLPDLESEARAIYDGAGISGGGEEPF